MKDDDNEEVYEQMSVGSGDAPNPNSYMKNKKKYKSLIDKRKISFIILLVIIILLGIIFILKTSYASSLSDQNDELQKEINSLLLKEVNLTNEGIKLKLKKESLMNDNNKIIKKINEVKEKNNEIKNDNRNMIKSIEKKEEKIKTYENQINERKNKLLSLIYKENNIREKIKDCNEQIKNLENKIEDLKKNLNVNDVNYKEKKKEEKKMNKNNNNINLIELDPELKTRINSKILYNPNQLYLLDKWFKKELKYKLLYRATDDGYSPVVFHNKVNKNKNTLVLIKDINNFIYGGFTRKTWDGDKIYKNDKNAIVFNLGIEKYYEISNENKAIFCDPDNLAIFGEGDIYIGIKSIKSSFPITYGDYNENKINELTMGYEKLIPIEIEVFQLS